jgi:CRP-like cAMP-binding protein
MDFKTLRQINLFQGLADGDLARIENCSRPQHKASGEEILCAGEKDSPVFFILAGSVRVYKINPEGREQTLIQLAKGEVFNLPTVFLEGGNAPASVMALEDTFLLRINSEDLLALIVELPALNLAILADLSSKMEHLTEVVHDLSLRSVRSRLARFLHTHSTMGSPSFWTQEQIAQQIGSTREAVNRALRELIKDGIIRTERQRIIVLDPARLETEIEV